MSKYKRIKKFFFFLYHLRMDPKRKNNHINAFKETKQLFNELRGNLSLEEINRIRDKL